MMGDGLDLRCLLLAIAVFGFATPAVAQAIDADEPASKQVSCVFERGQSWALEDGAYKEAAPSKLVFDVRDIDLAKQSASLWIDGKAAGTLRIIRALNANHFLEVANEGFLNLTTIYDNDAKLGGSPAVHSRHFGLLGQPVFAQYAGVCKSE